MRHPIKILVDAADLCTGFGVIQLFLYLFLVWILAHRLKPLSLSRISNRTRVFTQCLPSLRCPLPSPLPPLDTWHPYRWWHVFVCVGRHQRSFIGETGVAV